MPHLDHSHASLLCLPKELLAFHPGLGEMLLQQIRNRMSLPVNQTCSQKHCNNDPMSTILLD